MDAPRPIIIIKKKSGHAGHHGGAWKVAYADFVTAMMALFIVLWLLSSSEQVQKAVGGYFTDPKGHGRDVGNGLRGAGSESLPIHKDDMKKLKEKLEQAVKDTGSLPNKVTMEGHTDSKPFAAKNGYSNWELSADRANAARRWMQEHGVRAD